MGGRGLDRPPGERLDGEDDGDTPIVNFNPVRHSRASGEIVSQIERKIFAGELRVGVRLESERELAERFRVSRITLRDALRILEARGLVYVKIGSGGGTFVSATNLDQVAESISTMIRLHRMMFTRVAEARTVVETATCGLAAERADGAALAKIKERVERGRDLVREQAPHTEASVDFHVAVADAAGNELLSATVAAYSDHLVQIVHEMREARSAPAAQQAHEDIFAAIRAHDPEAARRLMSAHLQDFETRLRRWLAMRERERDPAADARRVDSPRRIDAAR